MLLASLGCGGAGCAPTFSAKAVNGITFFCPGIGNTDMAYFSVRKGLEAAGYEGEVSAFVWTLTFLPIDQKLGPLIRLRAASLAELIDAYAEQFPDKPVNVMGLSAGTGVALWAVESLKADCMVDNVVLLSSSLSHDYDVTKALKHIRGKIYVYYSPNDVILAGPMKLVGTIDGKIGVDGAGAVGLSAPKHRDRVVNIGWRSSFTQYGYAGGHLDSTHPLFVQNVLAHHIMETSPHASGGKVAMRPEEPAEDGRSR